MIEKIVLAWNSFNNNKDAKGSSSLYADTVVLYGAQIAVSQVVTRKQAFYDKHKDFSQSINGIDISMSESGYTVHFKKHTSFGAKISDVTGYLVIRQQGNDDWKITEESDDVTDKNLLLKKQKANAGQLITLLKGDFDGDGKGDTITCKLIKQGAFDEGGYIFNLSFSCGHIKPYTFSGNQDYISLINEGDLDGKPGDEFSIYAPPNHGCTYSMQAYHVVAGEVKPLIEMLMVPTACEEMSNNAISKRIFKENGIIYNYNIDPNDESESPKLIKTKAVLIP